MSVVVHRETFEYQAGENILGKFRAEPNGPWIHDPDVSAVLTIVIDTETDPDTYTLTQRVPVKYWKWVDTAVAEMSQAEKDGVDTVDFEGRRAQRLTEVDTRTAELVMRGFEYPESSGVFFRLDEKIHKAFTFGGESEFASFYPIEWSSADNKSSTTFADYAALSVFAKTGEAVELGHDVSGNALKTSLRDATDDAGLDAVVDSR